MATNDDHESSIALLRGLRTKTIVDRSFIHCADVCSAAPEELVAGLQPVPGTEVTENGYNSAWYFYCPKRYKNARGEPGGHRQRAVEPAGETYWHKEAAPKPVKGVPGATFCNLSYGRKDGASGRRAVDRLGWCMTEFDDTQGGGGDHVLCRVRRSSSSLAKSKFKSSLSSSSSSSKRKAADDHPEAPPTKLIHDEQAQVQVQQEQDPAAFFTNSYPTVPWPCYGYGGVDHPLAMVGGEEEHGVQRPRVEPEYGGEFNYDEQVQMQMQNHQVQVQQNPTGFFTNAYATMPACYGHGGPQQAAMSTAEHGGEFNFQDLLKTDEWKCFEDFLAQGEQQPSAEQGGGIVVSGGLLYAC